MSIVYQVSGPHIVSQNIDGEVIIVDLQNGYYFSVVHAGAAMWQGVVDSLPAKSIIEQMVIQYDASEAVITEALEQFFSQLKSEQLIVEVTSSGTDSSAAPSHPLPEGTQAAAPTTAQKLKFDTPALEKFTDMEDVLVLDPIHDVDDTGWPHAMVR